MATFVKPLFLFWETVKSPAHYPKTKNIGSHYNILLNYIHVIIFRSQVEGKVGDYFRKIGDVKGRNSSLLIRLRLTVWSFDVTGNLPCAWKGCLTVWKLNKAAVAPKALGSKSASLIFSQRQEFPEKNCKWNVQPNTIKTPALHIEKVLRHRWGTDL